MSLTGLNFETILPLIGAFFSFSFGVFVWLKAPKKDVNILFLGFCTAITYWLFGTFQMFLNREDVEAAVFWDRFVYLGVVFVPSLMHHFSLAITKNRGQRPLLALSYLFSVVFLVVSRTDYFVSGLNVFPRLVHTKAMMGHNVFLVLFFLDASLMFVNLYRYYRQQTDQRARRLILVTAAAFLNILIIGGTAYLPAYGIDIGYPFSYFSGVFFVILLSIAVTESDFLETRVLIAEMFTFLVGLIFAADIMLSESVGEFAFSIIALAVFLYFGFNMVRAMRDEIGRRLEVQKLALQLARANEQLKETDRLKSEFISIASHQLRTPISVIKGYLSLMIEGTYGPLNPAMKEKVEHMFSMNERLVHMINNMLNVSRIEKKKIEFFCSPVDVREIITQVADEMALKAREKGLTVIFAEPPDKPLGAYADAEKLHEVLANLIDNAIKYSSKGTVEIRARSRDRGKSVIITVRDEGIGMSSDEAKRLFQKFYRSKDPFVTREVGTGLGLYIGAVFIRSMGGKIWVEKTAPGKGTTFAMTLPTRPSGECVPNGS